MTSSHGTGTTVTTATLDKFLVHLREMPNVSRACRLVGVSRTEMYRCKREDVEFSDAWADALQEGVERLAEKAWHRAEESSDTLMIFLLRSHDPTTYGDKRDITSGGQPISSPVKFIEVIVPAEYVDDTDTSGFQEPGEVIEPIAVEE